MDVLTSETCWALNKEIIKQVTSSWSLFTQLSSNSITFWWFRWHSSFHVKYYSIQRPLLNCWRRENFTNLISVTLFKNFQLYFTNICFGLVLRIWWDSINVCKIAHSISAMFFLFKSATNSYCNGTKLVSRTKSEFITMRLRQKRVRLNGDSLYDRRPATIGP